MRVTVIGTGYVGLVAGACFSDTGNQVTCLDIDADKIQALKKGEIPIYEPGLETLVKRGIQEGRLHFTTNYAEAVPNAEVIFLAVGTPALPSGEPDTRYLQAAVEMVGQHLKNYVIIVNKSTVPIGSHQKVREWLAAHTKVPFDVASNPEFLKEGSAVDDFLKPDRVVIGTDRAEVFEKMSDLYGPFVRQGNPIIHMDVVSAEITKYACNAFLATRISFMNELARVCEKTGGDIEQIRKGMATDVRIGKHFLYAGVGYGGSCFPKDVQALVSTAKGLDIDLKVARATEEANYAQKEFFANKVSAFFNHDLKGKTIGIWGLAFKPNTDDMREAPSLTVIKKLVENGAKVKVFDPVAMTAAKAVLGDSVIYEKHSYDVTENADALVIVTEWNEFRQADLTRVKLGMKKPVVFDGRNIYEPKKMRALGFQYFSVGR